MFVSGEGGIFWYFLLARLFSTVSQGARIETTSLHTLRRGAVVVFFGWFSEAPMNGRNGIFCLPFGPKFMVDLN